MSQISRTLVKQLLNPSQPPRLSPNSSWILIGNGKAMKFFLFCNGRGKHSEAKIEVRGISKSEYDLNTPTLMESLVIYSGFEHTSVAPLASFAHWSAMLG